MLKVLFLDVTDYLLKPIRFERFLKAVNKAISIIEMNSGTQQENPNPTKENRKPAKDYLFVKSGFKSVRVNFHDILYVEGLKDYVNIYTTAHKYTKLERMKNIEAELPKEMFIRIHKSFIVSIRKVDSIFGNTIEIGGKQLPVGRSYKQVVMQVFS
jgi:DNA-binding LytR/AlgR family response regulator